MKWSVKNTIVTFLSALLVGGVLYLPGSDDANARWGPGSGGGRNSGGDRDSSTAVATLSYNESTHLAFMREEEKLARDVYITLGEYYPSARVFRNIVRSEQSHTDAVENLLGKYGVDDPVTDKAEPVGVFTGEEWGGHFTEAYEQLVDMGVNGYTTREGLAVTGKLAALHVGAFIEELDMHDIIFCPQVIVETENGVGEKECGQTYTKEQTILNVYQNLLSGSASHLKAYVSNIERIIGQGKYEAQYLTQKEVDGILGR